MWLWPDPESTLPEPLEVLLELLLELLPELSLDFVLLDFLLFELLSLDCVLLDFGLLVEVLLDYDEALPVWLLSAVADPARPRPMAPAATRAPAAVAAVTPAVRRRILLRASITSAPSRARSSPLEQPL